MVIVPPLARITWRRCWRVVSSRFPAVGLFDRVASPDDLDAVLAIERLTNDRLREEIGQLALVPKEDRLTGPGTTPIMAAFTHLNPHGSRFTDGSYGVYYAAKRRETAIAETRYHRAIFLAATREAPIEIDMRSYASSINSKLHDIRGKQETHPALYDPDDYSAPQAMAKRLHTDDSNGIAYNSVRHPGGECMAVFRPSVLAPVTQGPHYCYVWDGSAITDVYLKSHYRH